MDRIRAGLTGLGVVFLITAAASLLFAPSPSEQAQVAQVKEPGEPLSQLGVAPNNEKEPVAPPAADPVPSVQSPLAESPVNGPVGPASPGLMSGKDRPVEI